RRWETSPGAPGGGGGAAPGTSGVSGSGRPPATLTRASRRSSSTSSTTCPGMARHTVPPLAGGHDRLSVRHTAVIRRKMSRHEDAKTDARKRRRHSLDQQHVLKHAAREHHRACSSQLAGLSGSDGGCINKTVVYS